MEPDVKLIIGIDKPGKSLSALDELGSAISGLSAGGTAALGSLAAAKDVDSASRFAASL